VIVIVGCAWALVGGKHLANAAKDRQKVAVVAIKSIP
jgi:hypothetical protein